MKLHHNPIVRLNSALILVIALGGVVSCGKSEKRKPQERTVSIDLVVPPPPPPPPPPPQPEPPPQEEKKEEFVEETNPVEAPPEKTPEAPADSPPDLGLAAGDGPGGYGPSGTGRGGTGTGNGSNQNRSRFGWYAGQVQSVIATALQSNARTRSARFSIRVAIWADSTGRVTRARLIGTSGDPGLDQTIQNEILTGLQLREAPPQGMPMPIQLRLNARKAN